MLEVGGYLISYNCVKIIDYRQIKKCNFKKCNEILNIYEVHMISFQTFFVWALLLIVHT